MILTAQNFRVYTHTHTYTALLDALEKDKQPRQDVVQTPGYLSFAKQIIVIHSQGGLTQREAAILLGVGKTAVSNQVNSYSNSKDKKKWSYPQTKGSKALLDDALLAELLTTLEKRQWLRNCQTPAEFLEQIRDHVNVRNRIAGKPELDPDWMPSKRNLDEQSDFGGGVRRQPSSALGKRGEGL